MPTRGQSGIATVMAWNTSTNVFQTGNAANIEIFFIKDGVVATPTNQTALTESSSSAGGPIGAYSIAWTSAEGTCNTLWVGGQSSSANVAIIPTVYGFTLAIGSGTFNANVTQINGAAAVTSSAQIGVNLVTWEGDPPSRLIGGLVQSTFSGTTPAVNVTQFRGVASVGLPGYGGVDWSAISNSSAVQNFTQTTISGIVNSPTVTLQGTTSVAQFGVNIVTIAGTPTTGAPGYVGIDWAQVANPTTRQGLTATTVSGLINSPTVTLQGTTSVAQFGVNIVTIAGTPTVGAAGYVGIDWAQIANPTTRQGLTATTVSGVINSPTVTLAGVTSTAQFGVNVVTWNGDPVAFPTSLGTPSVNATKIGGAATSTSAAMIGVNLITWEGDAPSRLIGGLVQATFSGTVPAVNVTQWLGTGVSSATLGIPDINVKNINNATASTSSAQIGVNLVTWEGDAPSRLIAGLVQATFSGATPAVNVTQINGLAVVTSSAQVGVNVVTWEGDAPSRLQNGLVQVAVQSGIINSNLTTWLGAAPNGLNTGTVQVDVERWGNVVVNALTSGRVDATVGQMQANTIQTTTFNAGALAASVFGAPFLTSASFDATYGNALADDLGNRANAIETGLTPYQSWRLVAASQGGQLSGAGTTVVDIWGAGVSTSRISAVCDQSGNRQSVTLTL